MGFGTFILDLVRPRKNKKRERDPIEESLVDAMRKIIFFVIALLFGYLTFYTTTNFWDVVINVNSFFEAIATKLGLS